MRIIDGEYTERRDDSIKIARSLTAAGAPAKPPKEWFDDPGFKMLSPMTVTKEGRIMGHIAGWGTNHIGLPPGTKPPRSRSNYGFFKTGVVETEEGEDVSVGQLTLSGGHAPLKASAADAIRHYDDTQSAVADVTMGEDAHGIYMTGALRPGVTDDQIRALRASAPSGDWRPMAGALELVAVCQVNVPGFPVARAMVAGGQVTALVAAGAAHMYALQQENGLYEIMELQNQRISSLEESLVAAGPPFPTKKKTDDPDEVAVDEEETGEEEVSEAEPETEEDDAEEDAREAMRKRFASRKKS